MRIFVLFFCLSLGVLLDSREVPWERTFVDCLTGPNYLEIDCQCIPVDFDGDGDVDLADFGSLQLLWGELL